MDSGYLRGLVSSQQQSMLHDSNKPEHDQIMWEVMTTTDLEKRSENYHTTLQNKRKVLATGENYRVSPKNCILKLLRKKMF